MHHPTDRIAHTTAFVTPVVEHWLNIKVTSNTLGTPNNNNNNNNNQFKIIIIITITKIEKKELKTYTQQDKT